MVLKTCALIALATGRARASLYAFSSAGEAGSVWSQSATIAGSVDDENALCGTNLRPPCSADGACQQGHVLYTPLGLCSTCGLEGAFCCPDASAGKNATVPGFSCITGQECGTGRDPVADATGRANASDPFGLALVCSPIPPGVLEQSFTATNPPPSSRRVDTETGRIEWRPSRGPRLGAASRWTAPLDDLLGLSFAFYEIQRAGRLPPSTRIPWRADSLKAAGGSGSLDGDHQGGYFDAGDFNKFMLPHSYATARLCWTSAEFTRGLRRTSFDGSTNLNWAKQACKWGADFAYKAVVSDDQMLLHVGDIRADHGYIGHSEMYPQIDRDIRYCSSGTCSDIAGEVAATLAHAAVTFEGRSALSARYWAKARVAYAQTGVRDGDDFGNSNEAFTDLAIYYASSGMVSHVFFAAASMYSACRGLSACGDAEADTYLADAMRLGNMKEPGGGQKWFYPVPGWDNAWGDGALIMAHHGEEGPPIYGKPAFKFYLGQWVEAWTKQKEPVKRSPEGQLWTSPWGSLRFSLNGAAMLLLWARLPQSMRESSAATQDDARCAGVSQILYVAGMNSKGSYVSGFGEDYPRRNHHRNSACTPQEQIDLGGNCAKLFFDVSNPSDECPQFDDESKGICYMDANRPNSYATAGALIGGPKTDADAGDQRRNAYSYEGFNDWRTDWVGSEQALDYNAGFTMALAAATELPGSFWGNRCVKGRGKTLTFERAPRGSRANWQSYSDFEAIGWTRTLDEKWMGKLP